MRGSRLALLGLVQGCLPSCWGPGSPCFGPHTWAPQCLQSPARPAVVHYWLITCPIALVLCGHHSVSDLQLALLVAACRTNSLLHKQLVAQTTCRTISLLHNQLVAQTACCANSSLFLCTEASVDAAWTPMRACTWICLTYVCTWNAHRIMHTEICARNNFSRMYVQGNTCTRDLHIL